MFSNLESINCDFNIERCIEIREGTENYKIKPMDRVEDALDAARDAVTDAVDGVSGWWSDRVDEVRAKVDARRPPTGARSPRAGRDVGGAHA
jgi:hypothetical protein